MTVKIHVYAADVDKFFVNSFLVETDTGVVVVDTQFLVSSATSLRARLDRLGKPLAGIVITHPHPDHYNGLPVVLDGLSGIPVYATRATIDAIRATRAAKRAAWTPVYGDDYPTKDILPGQEIGADGVLTLAGTELHVVDLGPGESSDITIIHIPAAKALIASDLIYNECHPWLAEHRSQAWLDQLDLAEARFGGVATVHAGHGPSGGPELFGEQRRYIRDFRAIVARHAQDRALSPDAMARVRADTTRGRDGWPLEALIAMNAKAVAEEGLP